MFMVKNIQLKMTKMALHSMTEMLECLSLNVRQEIMLVGISVLQQLEIRMILLKDLCLLKVQITINLVFIKFGALMLTIGLHCQFGHVSTQAPDSGTNLFLKTCTNMKLFYSTVEPSWIGEHISSVEPSIYSRHSWTCNATGFPMPTYKWYKNGVVLDSR